MKEHKPKRIRQLEVAVGEFLPKYGRKKRPGGQDPNDRHYDRALERKIKQMKPEDLSKLMTEDE